MPIQELYEMPVVKKNDYRLYREAIGLISEEEIKQQRDRIREEGLKWEQIEQAKREAELGY